MDIDGPVKVGVAESSPAGNGRRRIAVKGFWVQQRNIPLSEAMLQGVQRAPGVAHTDLLS